MGNKTIIKCIVGSECGNKGCLHSGRHVCNGYPEKRNCVRDGCEAWGFNFLGATCFPIHKLDEPEIKGKKLELTLKKKYVYKNKENKNE